MNKIITLCLLVTVFIVNKGMSQDGNSALSETPVAIDNNILQAEIADNSAVDRSVDSVTTTCDSLLTTFIGGNSQKGTMFDVTAVSVAGPVLISGFEVNVPSDCSFEVYYHNGTYVGNENNASAWTLARHIDTLVSHGIGHPTPVALSPPITIPAGQTYSLYLTATNNTITNIVYTNVDTTSPNIIAQNANIIIYKGSGIFYPFSGTPFPQRKFNGRIVYCFTPVGIDEQSLSAVKTTVAPNPFDDFAIIKIDGRTPSIYSLKIYDVLGNTVNEINNITTDEVKIEKGKLNSGVYFYRLFTKNNALSNGKIIIE